MAADSYNSQNKTSLHLFNTFSDPTCNVTQYTFLTVFSASCCATRLKMVPLCVLWSGLWSRPRSFPRCLPWRWQRGRRTSCWRWCPDTMSLGTCSQMAGRRTFMQGQARKSVHRSFKVCSNISLRTCTLIRNGYKHVYCTLDKMIQTMTAASTGKLSEGDSYSMGNQSPQSSLTLSMSLWQRKRSWTSLRAVGGATSLIHTCRDQQREKKGQAWWVPVRRSNESQTM